MKVHYVQAEKTYLIANHAVAKNSIFDKSYFKNRILKKIHQYLAPVCDIHEIVIHNNQFQILVGLKSRAAFESYYRRKKEDLTILSDDIPESTYIFSQIMANFQASLAIHFNRKLKRTGAVFARRFSKILVEGSDALRYWQRRLALRRKLHHYNPPWYETKKKKAKENWLKGQFLNSQMIELQGRSLNQHRFDDFYTFFNLNPAFNWRI